MAIENLLLSGFYLFSVGVILTLIYSSYQKQSFSFHLLFSLIYFITFYLGYPLSTILSLGFDVTLQDTQIQFITLFSALAGYLFYYFVYWWGNEKSQFLEKKFIATDPFANLEAKVTACLLFGIALATVGAFLYLNGLLLFKLEKYNEIFSAGVRGVALKRFFYFFIPALLVVFFLLENKKAWLAFLVFGVGFGLLTYVAVGGTRANIVIAFALFFFIGLYKNYLSFLWLGIAGVLAIVAMFFLAMSRYNLDVAGSEAIFTFLYLTRDTFSPWENVSLLLTQDISFQGLMPIIRDFYVYIPKSLWIDRPDAILNTSNYLTWEVLNYHNGLAISPTLLGSLYIMGGFPMIGLGMAFIGMLTRGADALFEMGIKHIDKSTSALIKAYCFANIFNVIVLVREGLDAFFSRLVFFSIVFFGCWLIAKVTVLLLKAMMPVDEK